MSDPEKAPPTCTGARADSLTASLSEQYRGRLLLFAARRLRGNRAAAEDVVQEAFRTVLEVLRSGRIREPEALPAFAFETVRNLCMHHGRAAGREANAVERLGVAPLDAGEDILTRAISEQRRHEVREALGRLDAEDRRVLELTYVEEQTSEEIGRAMGLTAGAVRVRRHRALQRLSQDLGVTKLARWEPS